MFLTNNHVCDRQVENEEVANPSQTSIAQDGHPEEEVSKGCQQGEKCDA